MRLSFLLLVISWQASAASDNAPVQTLTVLEQSLKRACGAKSEPACPDTQKFVEERRKEVERIYISDEFKAALAFVYQPIDGGQAGLLDKGKVNVSNAKARTLEVKSALDITVKGLTEREAKHSDTQLKGMIRTFRDSLDEQSRLLSTRVAALDKHLANLNDPSANLTGISGVKPEERAAVKAQFDPVDKKMREFVGDPGLGTGKDFLKSVHAFCKQPGSSGLATHMQKNCTELKGMDFGVFAGEEGSLATINKAVRTISPAMMFTSGSSIADLEKRVREVSSAADKISWKLEESKSAQTKKSGVAGSPISFTAPLPPSETAPKNVPSIPIRDEENLVKAAITGIRQSTEAFESSSVTESRRFRGVHASQETTLFDITHSVMRQRWKAGAFK